MSTLLSDSRFHGLVQESHSRHELAILIGGAIRRGYPRPCEALPGVQKEDIADMLIATCSTEQEIDEVLSNAGFDVIAVSVMETLKDEVEKEALLLCQVMGGALTREGIPVMYIIE